MRFQLRHLMPVIVLGVSLSACQGAPAVSLEQAAPVAGYVTDVAAFDQYIATHPTPAAFRARYPDVQLVLPGEIATKEFRTNNSRYFAQLDANGRITGGGFR